MKQELAQDIALMRYSMISPLIVGLPDEYRSKEACHRNTQQRYREDSKAPASWYPYRLLLLSDFSG